MNTFEERSLRAMRTMAWERAKGELHSIACASYAEDLNEERPIQKFLRLVDAFIKEVEDEGLVE